MSAKPFSARSTSEPRGRRPAVAIVGTGALACLFGARLAAHARVTLLGSWKEQIERLADRGVVLEEQDGRRRRYPVAASDDPAGVGPADLVLVLVKSPATPRAADWAAELLAASSATRPGGAATGLALTLQNGLGNLELLRAAVGRERAAVGVTVQAAHLLAEGVVRHAGDGSTTLAYDERTRGAVERAAALLQRAGLPAGTIADGERLLWEKLAVSAAINPLSALLDVRNGFLVEHPEARRLLDRAAAEATAVAAAEGHDVGDAAARAAEVCRRTASNLSSMAQDRRRGAATEIDAITGAVVRAGDRHGLATPLSDLLWSRLGGPAADDETERSALAQRLGALLAAPRVGSGA